MDKETLLSTFGNAVKVKEGVVYVDASNLHYKDLNDILRKIENPKIVNIENICGQRYIGTDISRGLDLHIYGTPGNDLAALLDGNTVIVHCNAQDGVGNTMNSGTVVIHGRAGDIVGHSMRGGEIYIRNSVGYRCGIHMKEYLDQKPIIVVGGTAQDYLGEYMAGGILVVLGLHLGPKPVHKARFVGTGMHGGTMYIRGKVCNIGKEVEAKSLGEKDFERLEAAVKSFCKHFEVPLETVLSGEFIKLVPVSKRPYGELYVY